MQYGYAPLVIAARALEVRARARVRVVEGLRARACGGSARVVAVGVVVRLAARVMLVGDTVGNRREGVLSVPVRTAAGASRARRGARGPTGRGGRDWRARAMHAARLFSSSRVASSPRSVRLANGEMPRRLWRSHAHHPCRMYSSTRLRLWVIMSTVSFWRSYRIAPLVPSRSSSVCRMSARVRSLPSLKGCISTRAAIRRASGRSIGPT